MDINFFSYPILWTVRYFEYYIKNVKTNIFKSYQLVHKGIYIHLTEKNYTNDIFLVWVP